MLSHKPFFTAFLQEVMYWKKTDEVDLWLKLVFSQKVHEFYDEMGCTAAKTYKGGHSLRIVMVGLDGSGKVADIIKKGGTLKRRQVDSGYAFARGQEVQALMFKYFTIF